MDIPVPDEILLTIFFYLEPVVRSVICMSVCRRWRRVAHDKNLWLYLKFGPSFSLRKMTAFLDLHYVKNAVSTLKLMERQRIPKAPNLTKLILTGLDLRWQKLETTKDLLPSLRSVHVTRNVHIDPSVLSELKKFKPNVKVVIDSVTVYLDSDLNLDKLSKLCSSYKVKKVNLWTSRGEIGHDKKVQALFSLPPITELHAYRFQSLGLVSSPINLTDFTLYHCRISKSEAFQVLPTTCPKLESCSFDCPMEGHMVSVIPLQRLEKLTVLVADLSGDELLEVLKVWKNLKSVCVRVGVVSKPYLDVLSSQNPDLSSLNIAVRRSARCETWLGTSGNVDASNSGQLTTNFQSLEKLTVTIRSLGTLSLILAPLCTSLTVQLDELPFSQYHTILQTESQLPNVSAACPSLQCISLPSLKHFRRLDIPSSVNEFMRSDDYDELRSCEVNILRDFTACFPALRKLPLRVTILSSHVTQFAVEVATLLKSLSELEDLQLEVMNQCPQKTFFKKVREVVRPSMFDSFYSKASFRFFPSSLRRTLELQGFQHTEDLS